jgi:hypothetical protein
MTDQGERTPVWPTSPFGWIAIGAAAVGLGSWVVLPMITGIFREQYPITDTWLMPAIGMALIVIAGIINLLAVWPGRQRSVVNVVAAVVVCSMAIFFSSFVIGEGLSEV